MALTVSNPGAQYQVRRDAIADAIQRVLESGTYILGPEVDAFEREFAAYVGVTNVVGVASGTDALELALAALNIGVGDEVIAPSHTAIATIAAIRHVGATPVLVDVEPDYYTMDAASVERALGERTRAVVPVHLYGQPVDWAALGSLLETRGIPVIEDCAQAHGAVWRGRQVGSLGTLSCFSFFPTKNLGAIGDGGALAGSNTDLMARVQRQRQYGWDQDRHVLEEGRNSRLDELQAAILRLKLCDLDADTEKRRALAERYYDAFTGTPLALPLVRDECRHAYHQFVVQADDRDALIKHLASQGIAAGIHYPVAAHQIEAYAIPSRFDALPVTEALVGRVLSLPIYPELAEHEQSTVITAIRAFYD